MTIAVITGASSGIGREFAQQVLAGAAYEQVWLIARDQAALAQIPVPQGQEVRLLALDLREESSWQTYTQALQDSGRQIGLLINCAGIGKIGDSEQVGLASSLEMIDLNLRALTALTLLSLPQLARGGRIIQLSSAAGFQPLPGFNVYAACKAYVLRFSQALSYELKDRGVSVTAVCPNWVATPFIGKAQDSPGQEQIKHFGPLAPAAGVARKALRDAARGKLLSSYGALNRLLQIGSRFAPPRLIMAGWRRIQRF